MVYYARGYPAAKKSLTGSRSLDIVLEFESGDWNPEFL
jgi:hypothetical protein